MSDEASRAERPGEAEWPAEIEWPREEAGAGQAGRSFLLCRRAGTAPGVLWSPPARARPPLVLLFHGWTRLYAGDWRTALVEIERAMRLSPVDPAMFYFTIALCGAHFLAGHQEEAANWARRTLRLRPGYRRRCDHQLRQNPDRLHCDRQLRQNPDRRN